MKKILLTVLLALPLAAFSGGPLVIQGSDGNTPVTYPNPNVAMNFDLGILGSRTNAEADDLVQQAFDLWNAVPTSTINLVQGVGLTLDIDVTNYQNLLPNGNLDDPSINDGLSPLIYDTDGQIIDDFFGVGQSDNIAGFAASIFFVDGSNFTEGYAVLNGKNSPLTSVLVNTIAHEIGHLIGMDHSQLDFDNTEDPNTNGCTPPQSAYPIMYPFLCRLDSSLHTDDIAAVSALYPAPNISTTFGQITGFFTDSTGDPVLGANLWVENTATGDTYSIVSDYLKQNTGFFSILLPAGTYTLHANSINLLFFESSSVGPYANSMAGTSFSSQITTIFPTPNLIIDFEGSTPGSAESLIVTTGKATDVSFVTDGSGSFTTDNSLFVSTPVVVGGGGGGGIVSPVFFLFLFAGFWLRGSSLRLPGFCFSYSKLIKLHPGYGLFFSFPEG